MIPIDYYPNVFSGAARALFENLSADLAWKRYGDGTGPGSDYPLDAQP